MPTTSQPTKRPLTPADYKAHAKYVDQLRNPIPMAKVLHCRPARTVNHRDVARFVTEHWTLCQSRRCLLVDQEFVTVRGF